jgi:hypothetical protein
VHDIPSQATNDAAPTVTSAGSWRPKYVDFIVGSKT